ncbi:MAG: DUF58 domain-containing protein [Myxococcales bacterium]|nr:DUF58 domain-containing protein [Myxococcales bacterium]
MQDPATSRPPFPRALVLLCALPAVPALLTAGVLRRLFRGGPGWEIALALGVAATAAAVAIVLRRNNPRQKRIEARLRRFFAPPRRLQFTREGKYFVGITFGVGFAAINTGNNLLYLLLGMLLSLIIASGILSEMSLRGLEVSRRPPQRVHAARPFLMGIALKNGKRKLPSFSIEVEDLVNGKPLDKKCYFLKLPAGRRQQTSYRHTVAHRGRCTFTGFRLSTKFPFTLFRKSRLVEDRAEVVVLPHVYPVAAPPPPLRGLSGDDSRGSRARRGDFHGLREYRDGDDPRDVHWRSTARHGRPMVREHEDETARRVSLFLDNALEGGAACAVTESQEALERAVSLAASLAVHYLERGYAVRLVARGEVLPWAIGPSHVARVLRALALLPTVDETIAFAAPPEPGVETLYVARRGVPHPGAPGRVIEA